VQHLAGVTYQLKLVRCSNKRCKRCTRVPVHGPYWYAFAKSNNRTRSTYVGKELPPAVRRALADVARGRELAG